MRNREQRCKIFPSILTIRIFVLKNKNILVSKNHTHGKIMQLQLITYLIKSYLSLQPYNYDTH